MLVLSRHRDESIVITLDGRRAVAEMEGGVMSMIERFVEARLAESKAEVDRLRAELAACRAAREAAEEGRAILQRECDEWRGRWDALPASVAPEESAPPAPSREALGRIARAAFCRRSDSMHRRLPGWSAPAYDELDEDAREDWNCIGEGVAAAIVPPAPAAIVCVEHEPGGATCTVDVHAYGDEFDPGAVDVEDEARGKGLMNQSFFVRRWHWHGPAGTPDAAVMPPAPEAIVDVWDLRTDGHEVHAFAIRSDAEAFADAEPDGEERCITYTGGWTWHGPAAREGNADG